MLELTLKYKTLTENWQFASTRPQHSDEFQNHLKINASGLVPLDEEKEFEFLMKFSTIDQLELNLDKWFESIRPTLNFSLSFDEILVDLKYSSAFSALNESKSEQILEIMTNAKNLSGFKISGENVSPILIEMVVEAARDENFKITEKFNSYLLYENFVDERFKITVNKKNEVVKTDVESWIHTGHLTYKEAHQAFAIKKLFYDEFNDEDQKFSNKTKQFVDFKIEKNFEKRTNLEISRFGILTVNSCNDFFFVHRTFAEFFTAKFLIYNLSEGFERKGDFETELLIYNMFNQVFHNLDFFVVRDFITDYLDSESIEKIPKHLEDHKLKMTKLRAIINRSQ